MSKAHDSHNLLLVRAYTLDIDGRFYLKTNNSLQRELSALHAKNIQPARTVQCYRLTQSSGRIGTKGLIELIGKPFLKRY